MTKITSVRLDDDVSERLEALAESMDRPKGWLIEQAIKSYVEEQQWQTQAIREVLQDYRSGNASLIPDEQVTAEMEELEAEIEAELQK